MVLLDKIPSLQLALTLTKGTVPKIFEDMKVVLEKIEQRLARQGG